MNTQTASDSLHPPVIAGVPTGGESRGLFCRMAPLMKRPSFQFYPSDWQSNINLRRCSHAARGAWMDIMCALHDSDEYGILRWSLRDIAMAVGAPIKLINELVTKGVLKGSDKKLEQAFIYTPRSGRKEGDPVTLVAVQNGPIWFSSRMVKDEYIRTIRGHSTRFGESPDNSPKGGLGDPKGDGSSTSSPSSSSPSGEREKSAPAPGSPSAPIKTQPTSTFAESMTTTTAEHHEQIRTWINSLHPDWKIAWSYDEERTYLANARVFSSLTPLQRRIISAYMDVEIPDLWKAERFWQPDIRSAFIRSITDIAGHAERWFRRCKNNNLPTGVDEEEAA